MLCCQQLFVCISLFHIYNFRYHWCVALLVISAFRMISIRRYCDIFTNRKEKNLYFSLPKRNNKNGRNGWSKKVEYHRNEIIKWAKWGLRSNKHHERKQEIRYEVAEFVFSKGAKSYQWQQHPFHQIDDTLTTHWSHFEMYTFEFDPIPMAMASVASAAYSRRNGPPSPVSLSFCTPPFLVPCTVRWARILLENKFNDIENASQITTKCSIRNGIKSTRMVCVPATKQQSHILFGFIRKSRKLWTRKRSNEMVRRFFSEAANDIHILLLGAGRIYIFIEIQTSFRRESRWSRRRRGERLEANDLNTNKYNKRTKQIYRLREKKSIEFPSG